MKIILVLPENQFDYWFKLVDIYEFKIQLEIAKGGKTRFDSVKSGLELVKEGIVGVHDAVRPFVSFQTIDNAFKLAENLGNAIPVISVNESVRITEEHGVSKHLSREQIKLVQTPQCFDVDLLKEAYLQDYNTHFTDDASVVENIGIKINLTEGNVENIKITTPFDLKLAKALV
jgi:2-C-methyl-D-erythritol 4-phosphate cytidylyltransferase